MKVIHILFTFALMVLIFAVSKAQAATLILSPSSGTITIGQNISVDIMLDSQGAAIDGVDINSLRYNRTILEVQDADSSAEGIQITYGTLLSQTLANIVDAINGTIDFSQITTGGITYTGSGKLATIIFKGLSAGTSAVTFDFTLGSTSDSNVAAAGADVLTSVGNGSFTVTSVTPPAPSPSPSPTPTPTPTPTPPPPPPTRSSSGGGGRSSPTPTPTPTPTPSSAPALTRTVYAGSRGGDITTLQNFLITRGYLGQGNNTGFFGQLTRSAVQRYQCDKLQICSGDESSTGYGVVGQRTRAAMAADSITTGTVTPIPAPSGSPALTRTVYVGSRGSDITTLQNFLITKGYLGAGNNTGFFGQLTRSAVQRYQCDKLQVCSGNESSTGYGLVGQRTRGAINLNQ